MLIPVITVLAFLESFHIKIPLAPGVISFHRNLLVHLKNVVDQPAYKKFQKLLHILLWLFLNLMYIDFIKLCDKSGMCTLLCFNSGIYNTVIGLLNDTNVTLSCESNLSAKNDFAGLVDDVYKNELDLGQTALLLSPTYFANLLGTLDAYVYGGPEAIRSGYVPGLYGFKSVVCAPGLASGWKGALVDVNSIGIASRYLAPMAGAYVDAWKGTDPNSGLTIGFRSFANLCTGRRYLDAEVLFGAKVIRPEGLVSIK